MSHLVSEHPTICEAAKSAIVEVNRLCVGVGFNATLLVSLVGADPVSMAWHDCEEWAVPWTFELEQG